MAHSGWGVKAILTMSKYKQIFLHYGFPKVDIQCHYRGALHGKTLHPTSVICNGYIGTSTETLNACVIANSQRFLSTKYISIQQGPQNWALHLHTSRSYCLNQKYTTTQNFSTRFFNVDFLHVWKMQCKGITAKLAVPSLESETPWNHTSVEYYKKSDNCKTNLD